MRHATTGRITRLQLRRAAMDVLLAAERARAGQHERHADRRAAGNEPAATQVAHHQRTARHPGPGLHPRGPRAPARLRRRFADQQDSPRHGRTDPPPEPTSSTNPVSHPQWAARSATWWRSAAPELAGSRDPPAVERERRPSHPPRHPNPTARPYPGVLRVSLAMRNTVARLTPNCFPSCMRGMPASKSCCSHTVWTTSTWW